MHMDLETNMKMIGKRFPFTATYQVSIFMMHIHGHEGEWGANRLASLRKGL